MPQITRSWCLRPVLCALQLMLNSMQTKAELRAENENQRFTEEHQVLHDPISAVL